MKKLIQIGLSISATALSYYFTYLLWNSMIRDCFEMLPKLSFPSIVGIGMFIRLFLLDTTKAQQTDENENIIYAEFGRGIMLGVLYGAYYFFSN